MIFAFKILVMVMIIRISIATGYQPVFWGAFFGAITTAETLVFGGGLQAAVVGGLASGVIWGFFLWVLSKLEGRGIWWWVALIVGLLSPLIIVGTLIEISESKKLQGEYSAPNTHSSGPESIVCRDVAARCAALEQVHGLSFGPAVANLGQARVAEAPDGSLMGVRAPLARHEAPIIRTYFEVEDIGKAVEEAEAAGAMVA